MKACDNEFIARAERKPLLLRMRRGLDGRGLHWIVVCSLCLLSLILSFDSSPGSVQRMNGVVAVRAGANSSLGELIRTSGYSLEDKNVEAFLKDFARLNEDVKSLSWIPQGTLVRIPLKNLVPLRLKTVAEGSVARVEKKKRRLGSRGAAGDDLVLRNLSTVLLALTDVVRIKSDGVTVLSSDSKTELSVDTASFPMVELADKRVIMLDYRGTLPAELKDIIEVSWPEYRVISCRGIKHLKSSVSALLDTIGYSAFGSGRVIIVDTAKVELHPDFVVMKMGEDVLNAEIAAVSIVQPGEQGIPEEFKEWARNKGVRILDLYTEEPHLSKVKAQTVSLEERNVESLSERFLALLSYPVKRGETFTFSGKSGYRFAMRTDMSFREKNKVKAIQFSSVPEPQLRFAERRGIDVLSIDPRGGRAAVLKEIMGFVSLPYSERPEKTSQVITPRKAKYRLFVPGILVRSRKGTFFFTEAAAEEYLLSSLIRRDIRLVTF